MSGTVEGVLTNRRVSKELALDIHKSLHATSKEEFNYKPLLLTHWHGGIQLHTFNIIK